MLTLFEQERSAWVCYKTARTGVRPLNEDTYVYIHSTICGTTHVMELSHRFDVKNFVFGLSSSLYGGIKNILFDKDTHMDNLVSPYTAVNCKM